MNNCTHLCNENDTEKKYIKSKLCGSHSGTCNSNPTTIFHSEVFCNSVLSISITNLGTCNVVVSKNNTDIATIIPGATGAFLETNVNDLKARCITASGESCVFCWTGCVCSEFPCQLNSCNGCSN